MRKSAMILLNSVGLNAAKISFVLSYLGCPEKIFTVSEKELDSLEVLSRIDQQRIVATRNSDFLKNELRLIKEQGVTIVDIYDEGYPKLLSEIPGKPLVLYVKGDANILEDYLFAIVGTRIPSLYGMSMADEFSGKLSAMGFVIVSGMARGVDTAAHKAALGNGKTVAVLGSGLNNVYPKENLPLSKEISQKGAIISEFPMNTPPLKENFPRRNRIISGLSRGVLVIEAAARSGALITAHYALEQNREVFALPGNADSPLSRGSHSLIKEGAKLVDSIDDILEELNITYKEQSLPVHDNLEFDQKVIFELITKSGANIEELITKSNISQAIVTKAVLDLQLKGLIKEVRPSYFVRKP